ncbi:MAG: flagellar motor protein MotB [Phycisphaerae bacterium]
MRKKKEASGGAPEWMITYGDMMSLLLTFFVLLASLANFDERDKMFMAAIESIRRAFGNQAQIGYFADNQVDFKSLLVQFETMVIPTKPKNLGQSDEPGIDGQFYRVKKVRDGLELVVGGPIAFGRFSPEIEPAMDGLLQKLAVELRGKRNKIEIRGHATYEPLPVDAPYKDPLDLSYARARRVRDRLVELGVDRRGLRVTAAGPYERLLDQTYDESRRAANRRVEILLTQALIDDYEAKPQSPDDLFRQANRQP